MLAFSFFYYGHLFSSLIFLHLAESLCKYHSFMVLLYEFIRLIVGEFYKFPVFLMFLFPGGLTTLARLVVVQEVVAFALLYSSNTSNFLCCLDHHIYDFLVLRKSL